MNFLKNTDQNLWYKAKEGLSRKFIDRNECQKKENIELLVLFISISRIQEKKTTKQNLRKILGINKKQKLKVQQRKLTKLKIDI